MPVRLKPAGEVRSRHYLRVAIKDEVGTMAKVASVLAAKGVSIASVLQKDVAPTSGAFVPVIILTHRARQADMDAALAEITRLDIIGAKPVRLGIE